MCDTSFTYFHILSKHTRFHLAETGSEEQCLCLIESFRMYVVVGQGRERERDRGRIWEERGGEMIEGGCGL